MTDWKEAGRKADAHRVRDLYRETFGAANKAIVRNRVAQVLKAAGGTVCLDLWGGGGSAPVLRDAGLQVISVDNGGLEMGDRGYKVSTKRKRAALERTAAEEGYEARWGKAERFASEADVAFLDFCGPWSGEVRRTVEACRHMKAVVVTLVADHDIHSGATTPNERVAAYALWLKMAYSVIPRRERLTTGRLQQASPGRLLAHYRRSSGRGVYVFLVSRETVRVPHYRGSERWALMTPRERKTEADRAKHRLHDDPDWRTRYNAYQRAWRHTKRLTDPEALNAPDRHRRHRLNPGLRLRKPCPLCVGGGST